MSTPTKDDWKARIEPHLSTSLQTVSERITQTEAVQNWLRTASMKAAEGLGQTSGLQGEMQGYMRMMEDLKDELPELLDAVDELTDGYGRLDLHWRPLQPNFSRLYVDFDLEYDVELFLRIRECTPDAAQSVIASVANALPAGDPFPNRPNVATGLVVRDGQGIGIRVKRHLREDRSGIYRTVTLLPSHDAPIENIDASTASRRLRERLCSDAGAD